MEDEKLKDFQGVPVTFVETQAVKEGVTCDVYSFDGDESRDLGIITVRSNCSSPRQRIFQGTRTLQGYISGSGALHVEVANQGVVVYSPQNGNVTEPVSVEIGQVMQWHAGYVEDLVYYEICEPPYRPGRFEDLSE
jgi:hypothetical protein